MNEEEEEDLIKTEIDPTEVEAEIETLDEERGGRGNQKLNELLPTRARMFLAAGRWRRVSRPPRPKLPAPSPRWRRRR